MKDYNYTVFAEYYDQMEITESIKNLNKVLDSICRKNHAKKILDMTCGTGEQAIDLHKKGYTVVASDLNKSMLVVAKKKYPNLTWHQGDMRTAYYGSFDVVISIYNAIAHLSTKDFEKAVRNIARNLKENGIYIFDIFNADFMQKHFIKYTFIDRCIEIGDKKFVRFNKNTFDRRKNIMHIHQTTYVQKGLGKPKTIKENWDMQIYTARELQKILQRNGFSEVNFFDMRGSQLHQKKSLSILCVAKKKKKRS